MRVIGILLTLFIATAAFGQASLPVLVKELPEQSAVVIAERNSGKEIFAHQKALPLKPASVLKLAVSVAALSELGPEFRFTTEALGRINDHGVVPKLVIRGSGAPDFTIEAAWLMARGLKLRGVKRVESLIADDSAFQTKFSRNGQRAYETGASALSFNFNSLTFLICPTVPGQPARVSVDPFEVPVKIIGSVTTGRGAGTVSVDEVERQDKHFMNFLVGGQLGVHEDCRKVYRSVKDPVQYFTSTFVDLLQEVGIEVSGNWERAAAGGATDLLYKAESRPLRDLVSDMNHFSNNFIANQLLLAVSNDGSWTGGLQVLESLLSKVSQGQAQAQLVDASGLNHENRVSAESLLRLLQEGLGDPRVGPELLYSLPVGDQSGTLKDRPFDAPLVRAKTGTLDGVSSLAGLVQARSGHEYLFVIIQNGMGSWDKAKAIEDKIVAAVARL